MKSFRKVLLAELLDAATKLGGVPASQITLEVVASNGSGGRRGEDGR